MTELVLELARLERWCPCGLCGLTGIAPLFAGSVEPQELACGPGQDRHQFQPAVGWIVHVGQHRQGPTCVTSADCADELPHRVGADPDHELGNGLPVDDPTAANVKAEPYNGVGERCEVRAAQVEQELGVAPGDAGTSDVRLPLNEFRQLAPIQWLGGNEEPSLLRQSV